MLKRSDKEAQKKFEEVLKFLKLRSTSRRIMMYLFVNEAGAKGMKIAKDLKIHQPNFSCHLRGIKKYLRMTKIAHEGKGSYWKHYTLNDVGIKQVINTAEREIQKIEDKFVILKELMKDEGYVVRFEQ